MLILKMNKMKKILISAGLAHLKEKLSGRKLRLTSLFIILITANGCSEFALLASGASLASTQNIYARTYSGIDVLTIMNTEKDIKTHVYTNVKTLMESRSKR